MTISNSSLASTSDRQVYHLRAVSSYDNWGGDSTPVLSVLDDDLDVRIEWAEGQSDRWDVWCFDPTADFDMGDILLVEDADLTLALVIDRHTPFTGLRSKRFHHWEIMCSEHELSVAELKTEAGI